MARLFLMLVIFVTTPPLFAGTGFSSQEVFSRWLMFYYEKPEPDRIPDAVKYMSESGILDSNHAIPPVAGFLSGVFRDNPQQIGQWFKDLDGLKEKHLGVAVLGLWYSGLPDSQPRVSAFLDKHPKLGPGFGFTSQGSPMAVEQIPLEQGAWVLDALWGRFMATGESAPVERIITTLAWSDVEGDTNRLLISAAARWSLTSNAVQHKRVLEICEKMAKTQGGELAARLTEVIGNARKELQTPRNPAARTDAAR